MGELMDRVTTEEATNFLETAVRNWGKVAFDTAGLEDVRAQLERFAKQKVEAQQAKIARLREDQASQVIVSALVQGLHAQMFGVWSLGDPQLSHAALADSGQLHEAVHALVEALPAREALEQKP